MKKRFRNPDATEYRVINGEPFREYWRTLLETCWVSLDGPHEGDALRRKRRSLKYEITPRNLIARVIMGINPIVLFCVMLAGAAYLAVIAVRFSIEVVMPATNILAWVAYVIAAGLVCFFVYACKMFYDDVIWPWLYDRRELKRDETENYRARLKDMSRHHACELSGYPGAKKPIVFLTDIPLSPGETDYLKIYFDGEEVHSLPIEYKIGRLFQGDNGAVRLVTDSGTWCIMVSEEGAFDNDGIFPVCPRASLSDGIIKVGNYYVAVKKEDNIRLVATSDDGTDTVVEVDKKRHFKSSEDRWFDRVKRSPVDSRWLTRASAIHFDNHRLILDVGTLGKRIIPLRRYR